MNTLATVVHRFVEGKASAQDVLEQLSVREQEALRRLLPNIEAAEAPQPWLALEPAQPWLAVEPAQPWLAVEPAQPWLAVDAGPAPQPWLALDQEAPQPWLRISASHGVDA